ncbi:hypothetical protein AAJ72_11110 [Citromicrobium sp. RCC1885]|nr:hypothetical protein AAJ72_11110 [Citromicrobium sp. RCC1885]KPM25926.1 hypothetical protein AAJ74_11850 [Citromicrobium sp. RCC1878]MAO03164.1 ankyrin repeat domain-containing protein [Citromicrobium sp.]OAM08000.1 hypothetical protein A0U43_12320 [Citromicrobium sp. RCC1897]
MGEESISDRIQVMMRERLALYFRCTRLSDTDFTALRLIEEIVEEDSQLFEEVEATLETNDKPSGGQSPLAPVLGPNDDDPFEIRTMQNYLELKRRTMNSVQRLLMIRNFVVRRGHLQRCEVEEFEQAACMRRYQIAASIKYQSAAAKRIIKSLEGEYWAQAGDDDQHFVWHLIIFSEGRNGPIHAEVRELAFKRIDDESLMEFREGVEAAEDDGARVVFGQIVVQKDGKCEFLPTDFALNLEGWVFPQAEDENETEIAIRRKGKVITPHRVARAENLTKTIKNSILLRKSGFAFSSFQSSHPVIAIKGERPIRRMGEMNNEANARLLSAAKSGDAQGIIESLLEGADINAVEPETGMTALHWAAHQDSEISCAALLYGTDLSAIPQEQGKRPVPISGSGLFDEILDDNFYTETGLEALIDSFGDPGTVRKALKDATATIDHEVRDKRGALANSHIPLVDDFTSRPIQSRLLTTLTQFSAMNSVREGREKVLIVPWYGYGGSPVWEDTSDWDEEDRLNAPGFPWPECGPG